MVDSVLGSTISMHLGKQIEGRDNAEMKFGKSLIFLLIESCCWRWCSVGSLGGILCSSLSELRQPLLPLASVDSGLEGIQIPMHAGQVIHQ
jgi:hypothetical protein